MYGSDFGIEFGRPDPDTFGIRVDRCFFRAFSTAMTRDRSATVLSGWDANWMQALDPATTGLRSERTSLVSLGTMRAGSASCAPTIDLPSTATRSIGNSLMTTSPP